MAALPRWASVAPSAARLTESLRDIGYDFPSAIADLVDNSIAAGARTVEIDVVFDGADSRVVIADDGLGMTENGLLEAMRFGSRRRYDLDDLGRYGLGLKTASLSQARRLTVVTRHSVTYRRLATRMLDLDLVAEWDDWLVVVPSERDVVASAASALSSGTGTVVIWEHLDRVLPELRPEGAWAKRRLDSLARKTAEHLAMVFHRFLEGSVGECALTIAINGEKLSPWNPFAVDEPATMELPAQRFELLPDESGGLVQLRRWVLPGRDRFSSVSEFERLSGPLKWNRQQGLYVYRANRLVQWGGWGGVRGIDEHTKLARASLDFGTDLDRLFTISVTKTRLSIPAQLRPMLERPVHELCLAADGAYRKTSRAETEASRKEPAAYTGPLASFDTAALAIRSAAVLAGEGPALRNIISVLREQAPDVCEMLGF
jgi:hypothetical protein